MRATFDSKRVAAVALIAVSAIAAGVPVRAAGENAARTLNIGAAVAPNSFNPLFVTESIENELDGLVFNSLTKENDRGEIVPDLAADVPTQANGGISRDGRTITYRLRRDVTWQDGAPFTSDDVKFTWESVMSPSTGASNQAPYDEVRSVDTPDRWTVAFRLRRPFAPFVAEAFNSVTISYVVPAHVLRGVTDMRRSAFNAAPIGTGPYRLTRWTRGDRMVFSANDRYFGGAPKIRQIVVHEVPQENTGITQLRSHELDWFTAISEASYGLLKDVAGVRLVVTPTNGYRGIWINNERPLLRDVRVRRAIAYAIDKPALVAKVTHGAGTLATEDIPTHMWAYDKDVPAYRYDPAKAGALLREAGWTPGPDGILVKNGQPLEMTLVLRQGAAGDAEMAVMVQSWLHAVGMNVSIKPYPGSTLFALGPNGVLNPGKYDIDISGFLSVADPDDSGQFTCANRPPHGFNWTRYCDPAMDALQSQALATYDQAKRKAIYAKIETKLATDVPQIFIYYQPEIDAVVPELQNVRPSPVRWTWNAEQWSWFR